MDLSTIEGLTDAQKEALTEAIEAETSGLKSKNDELLGKLSSTKDKLGALDEKEKQLEEARKKAVEAEEAKLIAEGKYKEAQDLREAERAELVAKANTEREQALSALRERDVNLFKSEILSSVAESLRPFADSMLDKSLDVSYEEGKAKFAIKLGDKEFNTASDFLSEAQNDTSWSGVLSAPEFSGAGARGNSGEAANQNDPDAAFKERLKKRGLIN